MKDVVHRGITWRDFPGNRDTLRTKMAFAEFRRGLHSFNAACEGLEGEALKQKLNDPSSAMTPSKDIQMQPEREGGIRCSDWLGRVLVACEYSGSVRDAFARLGWDAWSCDLLPAETAGQHYQGDVRDILREGWDMMIAHPPCTYLARAGCRWLYPGGVLNQERYEKGMEARRFFEELLAAPIPRIAIENPVPQKVFGLPAPTQTIHPWQFGHEAQKTTLLWLKNLPPLTQTNVVGKGEYFYDKVNGWRHTKWFMADTCAKSRSRTFAGIAEAMANQWTLATRPNA